MKKTFLLYVCIAVFLAASGCDWWPPGIDDIGDFMRERQLWLDRNMQNYSFEQTRWDDGGPQVTTVYVINGVPRYFRLVNYAIQYSPDVFLTNTGIRIYALDEFGSAGGSSLFNSMYFVKMSVSEIYAELAKYAETGSYRIHITYDDGHIPSEIGIHSSTKDIVWNILYVRPIDPAMFEGMGMPE